MDTCRRFFDRMLNWHGIECKLIVCRRAVRLKETGILNAYILSFTRSSLLASLLTVNRLVQSLQRRWCIVGLRKDRIDQ